MNNAPVDTPRAATATTDSELPDAFPMRVQGVLLDMDGTLIDSAPAVERAWGTFLHERAVDAHFDHHHHGRPAREVLRELMPTLDEQQLSEAFERIKQLEVTDTDGVRALPGTERVIAELDAAAEHRGAPTWAIVTSCTRDLFAARWACTGLPEPAVVVTADDVSRGKPHPEPYQRGAERLGVDPRQCMVVEDAVGGLRSAQEAGCAPVAITTTSPAADLRELAAALITSLDDLTVSVEGDAMVVARR